MLAGEASGDLHAARFVRAFRARHPSARFTGTGGPRLEAEGVALLARLDRLAVMGFFEVLPRLPWFLRFRARVLEWIEAERPDLVVLVDYPGFNMRIARAARERGCRVLYYIAPQVWAWKERRAHALAETTDAVAVILPFEAALLRRYGVDAHYVGHPLLDRTDEVAPPEDFFRAAGLDPRRPVLAVLPGSRTQELDHHLERFSAIAREVVRRRPDVQPVFSRASTLDERLYRGVDYPTVCDTRALQRWADAALVKSGTSTLETALERTPFVIAYHTSPATAALARHLLSIDHIGLPNLVADERVVPEFLQGDVTPERVAPVLVALLTEGSDARTAQLAGLGRVIERLGTPGASDRVAELATRILDRDP